MKKALLGLISVLMVFSFLLGAAPHDLALTVGEPAAPSLLNAQSSYSGDLAGNTGPLNSWSLTICKPLPLSICPLGTTPVVQFAGLAVDDV